MPPKEALSKEALRCPNCDAYADKTPDGSWAHCATCTYFLSFGILVALAFVLMLFWSLVCVTVTVSDGDGEGAVLCTLLVESGLCFGK